MSGEVAEEVPADGEGRSAGTHPARDQVPGAVLVVRAATKLVELLTGVNPASDAKPASSGARDAGSDGDSGSGLPDRDDITAAVDLITHGLLDVKGSDGLSLSSCSDAELIDVLIELRALRAVTAAAEAHAQVAFDESQRAAAEQRGVPKSERGKGIADQLALARGVPVARAANELALARGLVRELPETYRRLASGMTSEDASYAVARETVCLAPADRAAVDRVIAPRLSARTRKTRAAAMARAEAARVDAASVVARIAMAERDRNVTLRPAPDAMVYLSALLPVKQGVAAYAALCRLADQRRGDGDPRSRGQFMADEAFSRLTGLTDPTLIPVEVNLVMPATSLLPSDSSTRDGRGETAARIGEHVIPADIARQIALIGDDEARRWIRRVFTDPISGEVRAVDERRRSFRGATRRAITLRDQSCRGCGAPIREIDHVTPHVRGGPTTEANGQGHCKRCNRTKELPGWSSTATTATGVHIVTTTTPTGHTYTSKAPPVLDGIDTVSDPRERDVPVSDLSVGDLRAGDLRVGDQGRGAPDRRGASCASTIEFRLARWHRERHVELLAARSRTASGRPIHDPMWAPTRPRARPGRRADRDSADDEAP